MANPYNVPGVTVQEVAQKMNDGDDFVLLDVREDHELRFANLGEAVLRVPLSQLAQQREAALPSEVTTDKTTEIIVMCHHGNRSAQVTSFLLQSGWTNVYNMDGGIDAYALEVDASVGRY